jgi:hypothetical protein
MAFPAPHADGAEQPTTAIEPRPDGVVRGLRLASSDDALPKAGMAPRPLTNDPLESPEGPQPDPPAPSSGGGRPSLKRVK